MNSSAQKDKQLYEIKLVYMKPLYTASLYAQNCLPTSKLTLNQRLIFCAYIRQSGREIFIKLFKSKNIQQ